MSKALINKAMLIWARERAGVSVEEIAGKVPTPVGRYRSWERGDAYPTMRQANTLAAKLSVPVGYFYLDAAPPDALPLPDFRSRGTILEHGISLNLRDLISDVIAKQEWYRQYLLEHGADPLAFVGRFTTASAPADVAVDMNRVLGTNEPINGWNDRLPVLIRSAEISGISVMRSGIVGVNTHRPIDVDEIQGFAICDSIAPVVFLNSRDWNAALLFTLAHELAHIWIGESAVVQTSLGAIDQDQAVERFCNRVAAEFLVPAAQLEQAWSDGVDLRQNVQNIQRRFRVSSLVAAIRAYELSIVDREAFLSFRREEYASWRQREQDAQERRAEREQSQGGHFYNSLKAKTGDRLSRAIVASASEGSTLFRDACALLGVRETTFDRFASEL